jgi:hypothetical protein
VYDLVADIKDEDVAVVAANRREEVRERVREAVRERVREGGGRWGSVKGRDGHEQTRY